MPHRIIKKFDFEAAHYIPTFPDGHKCRNIHGHSYKIEVKLEGTYDAESGILMNFSDVKKAVMPYIEYLDHSLLNDLAEKDDIELLRNPTSENICLWLYQELLPKIPMLKSVLLHETGSSACEYFE